MKRFIPKWIQKLVKKNRYKVYLGLGGNIGNVGSTFKMILKRLVSTPEIFELKSSRFYETTPVSPIPQDPYVNAVCSFETTFLAKELLKVLQQIERDFGKVEKLKDEPRPIDLDILLYGEEAIKEKDLEIPHPHWQERLFVLIPLSDLTDSIEWVENNKRIKKNISLMLKEFKNIHNEKVTLLKG